MKGEEADPRIEACLDRGELREAVKLGIQHLGPGILGYLAALLRDEESAKEVFSQFSEALLKSIGRFERRSSFRAWAYKVAWNTAKAFRRDGFRRRTRGLEDDEISKIAERLKSTTAMHLKTAAKDRVSKLREMLTPDEQTLLILRVDRDLSWTEVAEVMTEQGAPIDEAALRKRYERVKRKLKTALERDTGTR